MTREHDGLTDGVWSLLTQWKELVLKLLSNAKEFTCSNLEGHSKASGPYSAITEAPSLTAVFDVSAVYPDEKVRLCILPEYVSHFGQTFVGKTNALVAFSLAEDEGDSDSTPILELERSVHEDVFLADKYEESCSESMKFSVVNSALIQLPVKRQVAQLLFSLHILAQGTKGFPPSDPKECPVLLALQQTDTLDNQLVFLDQSTLLPVVVKLCSAALGGESEAETEGSLNCTARYDLVGDWMSAKAELDSVCKLCMECRWQAIPSSRSLSAPSEKKHINFSALLVSSHRDRESLASLAPLRSQLATLCVWSSLLELQQSEPQAIATLCFSELKGESNKVAVRGIRLLDEFLLHGLVKNAEVSNLSTQRRNDLDFCEQLFAFAADYTTDLVDLTECLAIIVDDLENLRLSPFLHRSNRTKLCELFRKTLAYSEGDELHDSKEVDTLLMQPLTYMVELGIYKLQRDMAFFLTQGDWLPRLVLEPILNERVDLGSERQVTESIHLLRQLYRIVELGTFLKQSIPQLPSSVLQNVLTKFLKRILRLAPPLEVERSDDKLATAVLRIRQLGNDELDTPLSVCFELPKLAVATHKTVSAITKTFQPSLWKSTASTKVGLETQTFARQPIWHSGITEFQAAPISDSSEPVFYRYYSLQRM